jgi:regulator of cell morphogenesis and NO signaling
MKNIFLQPMILDRKSFVADIVASDHRAADVFRKHGISYCCGGKWPLEMVCEMKGLDIENLQAELEMATRNVMVSNLIDFNDWDTALLIGYITGVHHRYLRSSLPQTGQMLVEFVAEHRRRFSRLDELERRFKLLENQLDAAMDIEEEVLFPYIKRLDNAHRAKEPYAALLVRTLRKPVEESLAGSHRTISELIMLIRQLTDHYTAPANACVSHKVVMAKLKELDNDLAQHLHLEESVLFARTTAMEKELLGK